MSNSNILKKHFDINLIKCIILCTVAAAFSFVWAIVQGNGFFTVRDDFDVQQLPFSILAHNMLEEGFDGWCWNLDLGSSVIQGLSFYNLGSPFFWISLLFPAKAFPYIVGFIYILKYVVAGALAYIYIKLFVKDSNYAVLGAILYAFSGFQSANLLFYHFHDVVAFFPLLLYGLEKAVNNDEKSVFVFAVFLNCLINYYFFVQEVVFLIIYFVFRFIKGDFLEIVKKILKCALCGILGISMAAILFLPNIQYILSTTRNEAEFSLSAFFFNPIYNLFVVKGLLLPGEAMHDNSSVIKADYSSTGSYLPLVGLTLVFAYFSKNKNWLSGIIKFLIILSFFPFASSCFILFAENNRRWWYMLVLLMALASAFVLENKDEYKQHIKKGVILNAVILIVFYLAIRLIPWQDGLPETLTFHNIRLFGLFALTLSGIIFVFIATKLKKQYYRALLSGIVIFCVLSTSSTLYFYRRDSVPNTEDSKTQFELAAELEVFDEQYRYNISNGISAMNILSMSGDAAGICCFSSTVATSLSEFDSLFDYQNFIIRMDKNTVSGLPELLGAKYSVSEDKDAEAKIIDEISVSNKTYYVIEKDACPIGYRVSSYIYRDDLKAIEKDKRGIALLSAAVVEPDDEKYVNDVLNRVIQSDIDFEKTIDEYVAENTAMAVTDFDRSTKGFTCKSNYDSDSVIYFTVPYDEGWTAFVDSEKVDIIPSGGMMLLPVDAGEHNIEFTYSTPGYKMGATVSVIAISIYVVWIACGIVYRKRKSKVSKKVNQGENIEGKDY